MSDQDKVYQYLITQNRPFSASDIFNYFNKDIGKTSISKSLDNLVEGGKVKEKLNGKQKVYLINQDILSDINNDEMLILRGKLSDLQTELNSIVSEYNKAESELKMLTSSMSSGEAKLKLEQVNQEISVKSEKLNKLKENVIKISTEERKKVLSERTRLIKEWRKRKRMANEMMDAVLENYPQTKKQFMEEVGIEVDEDCNVRIPEES